MRVLFLVLALLVSSGARSATQVWLIAGGNSLGNSQGQIEDTVRWLQSLLKERGVRFRTYFTSGKEPAVDVSYFVGANEREPNLELILRVFGEETAYAIRTRRNALEHIDGSTEKGLLLDGLRRDLTKLSPGDSVLIVYAGHGDVDYADTQRNSLKLWGDGRLDVKEFTSVLDSIDSRITVRLVMTQCFSGAFAGVAFTPPLGLNTNSRRRCGFFSQSETREAEGCDLSINRSEYRDYSTYFFAALAGRSRLGELMKPTDALSTGQEAAGYAAAHYYALKHGRSLDLPRSTSEIYLEKVQPWYLRWNSFSLGQDGDKYLTASRFVAEREGIPAQGSPLVVEAQRRADVKNRSEREVNATAEAIESMQATLRKRVIERFPIAAQDMYWEKLKAKELAEIGGYIARLSGYAELRAAQDRQDGNFSRYLAASRAEGLAQRVLWLNRIARLRRYEPWLSSSTRATLMSLQECEDGRP